MKIAIYGQFYPKHSEVPVQKLFDFLSKQDAEIRVEKKFLDAIAKEHDLDLERSYASFEDLTG